MPKRKKNIGFIPVDDTLNPPADDGGPVYYVEDPLYQDPTLPNYNPPISEVPTVIPGDQPGDITDTKTINWPLLIAVAIGLYLISKTN